MVTIWEHGCTPISRRLGPESYRPTVKISWEGGGKSHEETVEAPEGVTFKSGQEADKYAIDTLATEWIKKRIAKNRPKSN